MPALTMSPKRRIDFRNELHSPTCNSTSFRYAVVAMCERLELAWRQREVLVGAIDECLTERQTENAEHYEQRGIRVLKKESSKCTLLENDTCTHETTDKMQPESVEVQLP